MYVINHIHRLFMIASLALTPLIGYGAEFGTAPGATNLGHSPSSISAWNLCENIPSRLCGQRDDSNPANEQRIRTKDVVSNVFGDMVEEHITFNLNKKSLDGDALRPDATRFRLRFALAFEGAQIGLKSATNKGTSLSLRRSDSAINDDEIYTSIKLELHW